MKTADQSFGRLAAYERLLAQMRRLQADPEFTGEAELDLAQKMEDVWRVMTFDEQEQARAFFRR